MKRYKLVISGINIKNQRTNIFDYEFNAKNKKQLAETIENLKIQYFDKENADCKLTISRIVVYEMNEVVNSIINF